MNVLIPSEPYIQIWSSTIDRLKVSGVSFIKKATFMPLVKKSKQNISSDKRLLHYVQDLQIQQRKVQATGRFKQLKGSSY